MKTPLLIIKSLSKEVYSSEQKTLALKNLSLHINPGEIYGLIGGSGSGKSTLTRLILGLTQPTSGTIEFSGAPLTSAHKNEISIVFQDFNLLASKTVLENIAFPLVLRKDAKAYEKARALLEEVGLEERGSHFPEQLSGGQKQRCALARALITKPKLLICDEATSSLDPESTLSILELLNRMNEQLGVAILLITHEMDVIKNLCHRLGVLSQGELVEEGELKQLIAHPKHEVTRSYLEPYSTRSFQKYFSTHTTTFWRLCFLDESARNPVITELVQTFSIEVNILMGGIDFARSSLYGTLVVEVKGEDLKKAKEWLKEKKVHIEELTHESV